MADEFTTDTTQWAIAEEGVYVDNPEFIYVKTDAKDKILWAIKTDGSIYYGAGCPEQIKEYIEKKIAELSLDEYEDIVAFLQDYLGVDNTLKSIIGEWDNSTPGKKISILGDSISTFNQEGYMIPGYAMWYPHEGDRSSDVTTVNDTWWMQVINSIKGVLEVNASYSGSTASNRTVGFSPRVPLLGNPDIIYIALGTNDSGQGVTVGEINFEAETYDLTQFAPAYIKGMQDTIAAYPKAKIVCVAFDMSADYQNAIKTIAEHYSAEYIYVGDISDVHPNKAEMTAAANRITSAKYTITDAIKNLSNGKVDKETGKSLIDADYASSQSATDNPEFLEVTTDSEDKVLEGIKEDGTKVIGGDLKVLGNMEISGVSYKVIENPEYLAAWVDAEDKVLFGLKADGKTYVGDADFFNDIKDNQEAIAKIKTTLATIVVKVDSLDIDVLSSITATENPEYIEAKTDLEGKLLAGRTSDGAAFENVSFSSPKLSIDGHIVKNIKDPEGRTEVLTDNEEKIISYRDSDGVKHEEIGVVTNHLNLTETGMTEFQQALKDAGFNPGGTGDYTDKDSMYIPEPRLAHLNIITNYDLTNLSKTSDIKCAVEFFDGAGNFFRKYVILNGQGRSSLNFKKKGLGMDFFNENPNDETFDEDNTFAIKFSDWVYQDSFHIKSYYTDWPRCTTPIVYKLAREVKKNRGLLADTPYKKYYVGEYTDSADINTPSDLDKNMETGAMCIPDGFPVIVYQNGVFWGVNSWQLKKHRDNYMLSKKKATNIHLDGDMGVTDWPGDRFWDYNGTINWAHFCSGVRGIEIRNPKNLYCIDGKKYDVDTHDAEIITTAIAEEWIAAGQIIPTGKTIDDTLADYLRTTGKVRKNIEDLTTYIPYIQGLADGSILIDSHRATTEEIRSAIADRFDIESFIDFILISNVVGDTDCWDNNAQIVTWGKLGGSNNLKWSVNIYDCDCSLGAIWNGTSVSPANNTKYGNSAGYPLYKIFWDYYYNELTERYKELRDSKIFDADHIVQLFRDWMNRVGYDNYEKEYDKWPDSPCFRDGTQTYIDNPTTGGFYGSIYRIYLWVKKRIEFMDAESYFDYNQN